MPDDPRVEVRLADDEEPLRALLEQQLRQAGYRVSAVADGPVALAAIQEHSYDVAMLDILMPGLDGIEVLRRISHEEERPEVIVVTGHGTVESALGAYDYVTKPYHAPELILLVRKAWEKRWWPGSRPARRRSSSWVSPAPARSSSPRRSTAPPPGPASRSSRGKSEATTR